MLLAVALSLLATWIGIVVAYDTGWPVGFLISTTVGLLYLGARLAGARLTRPTHGGRATAITSIDGRPVGSAHAR
jgi:hypothetical protein